MTKVAGLARKIPFPRDSTLFGIYGGITEYSTDDARGPATHRKLLRLRSYRREPLEPRKKTSIFTAGYGHLCSSDPPAVHTTGRGREWPPPYVYAPSISVAHSYQTAISTNSSCVWRRHINEVRELVV